LAVTAGEPAGIGPELCLQLAADDSLPPFIVVGDPDLLQKRAETVNLSVGITEIDPGVPFDAHRGAGELLVVPFRFPSPVVCGSPDPGNAATLLDGLRYAVDGAVEGRFRGLVTAPVHKAVINDAGFPFTGHTEFIAGICGAPLPVMLLVAEKLRVALATTHLPLKDVPAAITKDSLRAVIRVLVDGLRQRFRVAEPEVIVCGLNPHAGEGGHLGHEDDAVIAPVVAEFAAAGERVRGPLPADTAFTPAAGHSDAILAMYHDQGLPVLKYAGFGEAVNITLGLPIIRTSVDHGTALDIAGRGIADPGSLRAALQAAASLDANS
jgi:4-hydroxythreonine-4-phosphate dehydrogenase